MEITEVRLHFMREEKQRLKATASITIDNCFVVHDLRVVEGDDELFVAMPNKRGSSGEYRDIAHPINNETRDYIAKIVLEKYKEERAKVTASE
ncbi:MAG: septation regulator SpoVG [Clostridiales bacterium]|nr:septation regulator SpoVG [Clostridiales bacterium]